MTRHLAHFIRIGGYRYPMSVAEISDDRRVCRVTSFSGEIHSTVFHNGEIEIKRDSRGLYEVSEIGRSSEKAIKNKKFHVNLHK